MINEPPTDELNFHKFWFADVESQRNLCGDAIGANKDLWLEKQHFLDCEQVCKQDIWIQCQAAGTRIVHLRKHFSVDIDNLGRQLAKGRVSDVVLIIICKISGIDPAVVKTPPTQLQRLRARIRTVETYEQRCRTIHLSPTAANRVAIACRLSIPHGALLHVLASDLDLLNSWRYELGATREIARLIKTPGLIQLLEQVYEKAIVLVTSDANSTNCLRSWCPTAAGFRISVGRIAQAWNPYQLHWFFAQEVFEFEP